MNDTALFDAGMKVLIDNLGLVEAERFVYLMNKEPFDYTKWHSTLYEGMSVREISAAAMELRRKTKNNEQ
jgi:hypothetical protein